MPEKPTQAVHAKRIRFIAALLQSDMPEEIGNNLRRTRPKICRGLATLTGKVSFEERSH